MKPKILCFSGIYRRSNLYKQILTTSRSSTSPTRRMFELISYLDSSLLIMTSWKKSSSNILRIQVLTPKKKYTKSKSIMNRTGLIRSSSFWLTKSCQLILLRHIEWRDWWLSTWSLIISFIEDRCLYPCSSVFDLLKPTISFGRYTKVFVVTTWGASHYPIRFSDKDIIGQPYKKTLLT